jgi:hypothetical protein
MQSVLEANRAHTGGHDRPGAIVLHSRVFVRGSGEALHFDGQKLRKRSRAWRRPTDLRN